MDDLKRLMFDEEYQKEQVQKRIELIEKYTNDILGIKKEIDKEYIMSPEDYNKLKSLAKEIESIRKKYNLYEISIESNDYKGDLNIIIRAACHDDFRYADINNNYKDSYDEFCKVCNKINYCRMQDIWCKIKNGK